MGAAEGDEVREVVGAASLERYDVVNLELAMAAALVAVDAAAVASACGLAGALPVERVAGSDGAAFGSTSP